MTMQSFPAPALVGLAVAVFLVAGCQTAADPAAGSRAGSAPTGGPTVLTAAEADPDRLRFMQPEGVVALIGEPSFRRRDMRVTVWQYRSTDCVMDLFWYDTEAGPELMHIEARDGTLKGATEARTCFTGLLTQQVRSRGTGPSPT